MLRTITAAIAVVVFSLGFTRTVTAQTRPDPTTLIAAQTKAMTALSAMDGVWRGPAWTILPSGEKHHVTQTERIGPFLGGAVKFIEGRGYDTSGQVVFNAFGIVSFDPALQTYSFRTYAQGYAGDYKFTPTPDGFAWEIPAGPATIRYTAVIKDGTWSQTGDRITPNSEPVRFFEMNLKRVGDSAWPGAGAIPMK